MGVCLGGQACVRPGRAKHNIFFCSLWMYDIAVYGYGIYMTNWMPCVVVESSLGLGRRREYAYG